MMPKLNRTSSNSDLQVIIKSQQRNESFCSAATPKYQNDKVLLNLKRRTKLKQQEKYGRIRLGILVLAIFFIIFLSFVSNSRTYQPITVIVPHDDIGAKGIRVYVGKINSKKILIIIVHYFTQKM